MMRCSSVSSRAPTFNAEIAEHAEHQRSLAVSAGSGLIVVSGTSDRLSAVEQSNHLTNSLREYQARRGGGRGRTIVGRRLRDHAAEQCEKGSRIGAVLCTHLAHAFLEPSKDNRGVTLERRTGALAGFGEHRLQLGHQAGGGSR